MEQRGDVSRCRWRGLSRPFLLLPFDKHAETLEPISNEVQDDSNSFRLYRARQQQGSNGGYMQHPSTYFEP